MGPPGVSCTYSSDIYESPNESMLDHTTQSYAEISCYLTYQIQTVGIKAATGRLFPSFLNAVCVNCFQNAQRYVKQQTPLS